MALKDINQRAWISTTTETGCIPAQIIHKFCEILQGQRGGMHTECFIKYNNGLSLHLLLSYKKYIFFISHKADFKDLHYFSWSWKSP